MRITGLITHDLRFPTSASLDGSDAMNPDPDYSAAYVVLETDDELVVRDFYRRAPKTQSRRPTPDATPELGRPDVKHKHQRLPAWNRLVIMVRLPWVHGDGLTRT